MLIISLFLATLFLAYSNGANDNFKGVATLFGSRTTSYQTAILWGSFTTFAGAIAAVFWAGDLVKKFTAQEIFPDAIANVPEIHLAVAITTGLTVLVAALTGFPISTTHSITGALLGAGLVAIGLQVKFAVLGRLFLLPLFLSPIVAIFLAVATHKLLHYINSKLNLQANQRIVYTCHLISSGLISFSRGFNYTPKIVSLVLIIDYFSVQGGMLTIAMAMGLGGLLNSQKIAETMSHKIAVMNHNQGLSANIATGILMIAANYFGLPVSMTQVSVSSIFGVGLIGNQAKTKIFYQILFSWIFTLPIATIISGIIYRLLQ
ncbi:inorganic phosphate transporter [Nodularia sp. NIES-3585]|uniref:inorganic phosphate transporter n=1 Tax=Nodularia sp. NIES-3585 TaxID=1973477 RepID=UPI000B5C9902|nr:inorganic phosphate transporter [Nodularia sp. NIES-3585]GAX38466.1 phosphate transporter [Nodularia sp. NIES-3585]